MGRALRAAEPAARAVFDEADDALGAPLSSLCFEGDPQVLRQTVNAQPALLTHAMAALAVLRDRGEGEFVAAAGHSLGEWTAFVAAGSLAFADAVRLVRLRGELMQAAVPVGEGAMVALLGVDENVVLQACEAGAVHGVVAPATYNGNGHIVISGVRPAVERAAARALELGALKAVPLKVSAPFHCALMEPARAALHDALARVDVSAPTARVCSNVDAAFPTEADAIRTCLVEQLVTPVRWEPCLRALADSGVTQFTVVGAGGGLARMVQRLRLGPRVSFCSDENLLAETE